MIQPLTRTELEAAHCWFSADYVPRRPEVTQFKRQARLHQSRWRERAGLPVGSHRSGRPPVERANGSKIARATAATAGSNFLSENIRAAVRARVDAKQPHETLDADRLWADLLSSMPMCFNLFGELHDPARLEMAAKRLWPTAPGTAIELRFEWSPGRRDARYLDDRTAFDAAILLEGADGTRGVIGIETKYHEHIVREAAPDPRKRPRYAEVTDRSRVFVADWRDAILGTDLQQIWRDHVLVLSMLQADQGWSWGRYVLVHPARNPSFADAARRYRQVLTDDATFEVRTIEDLIDEDVLHPPTVAAAFRDRYLWDD